MHLFDLPKDKHKRFLEAAYSAALCSPGVGGKHRRAKIGAVLIHKKTIVAAGYNSYKTHPLLCKHFEYPYFHAEAYCVLSLGLQHCIGTHLYIIRIHRNGSLALARPCSECQALIKFAGISRVFYSTESSIGEL